MKIHCHVKPNAKHDEGITLDDGVYIVRVKAAATEGKANAAVRELLAAYFNVARSHVVLVSGQTAKHKIFEIT